MVANTYEKVELQSFVQDLRIITLIFMPFFVITKWLYLLLET